MNNLTKHIFLFIFGLSMFFCSYAQTNTDEQLANQYYNNNEFDKAVVYYEKLFNKTNDPIFYEQLLSCYLKLENTKEAEKLTKKQAKRFPAQLYFLVDIGWVYKNANESENAKKAYEDAIKTMNSKNFGVNMTNQQVIELSNRFIKYKEPDYAITTYLNARKIFKGRYNFNFELAQVYHQQNKTDLMLNEYLEALDEQPAYIQNVQNILQTNLEPDENGEKKELLKSMLIKRTQKNQAQVVFSEMLIWLYVQERNFKGALIQAKALDKRFNESGKRIVELGSLSFANKDYDAAIACNEYIIDLGKDNFYYFDSKIAILEVYNAKITQSANYTNDDIITLEKKYETTLNELGKTANAHSLIKDLAHLKAFYLNKPTEALELLTNFIETPRLDAKNKAYLKLELANVYLFIGDIWEASLLYSQIDKEFKQDQLGETAKYYNAKISFYTGDFDWAKAQLDVLKASTSKLIANDAMKLSISITDNIGIDTTKAPLLIFAQADLFSYQNKNNEALHLLDSLEKTFPIHVILDDVLYKRYEIYYKQQNIAKAIEQLEKIVKEYSYDILVDDALYQLALIYDYDLKNEEKAAEYYKKIMFEHQGSIYTVDARKRFREIQQTNTIFENNTN